MKIRQGFVSNSSSSSFIVISDGPLENSIGEGAHFLEVPEDFGGETKFGWENKNHHSFGSKLNFTYIQAQDHNDDLWISMLEKVVKEHLRVDTIEWNLSSNSNSSHYAYIDHQSAACEGKNIEMFESEERLKQFLFCTNSYIHNDNDNY
jgi:hypothetical protein